MTGGPEVPVSSAKSAGIKSREQKTVMPIRLDDLQSEGPNAFRPSIPCRKPPEEAVGLPLWPVVCVSHAFRQIQNNLVELSRSGLVYGLLQIVRWRVIAFLQPILMEFFFRGSRQVAEFERQRGYALADEAVLVT